MESCSVQSSFESSAPTIVHFSSGVFSLYKDRPPSLDAFWVYLSLTVYKRHDVASEVRQKVWNYCSKVIFGVKPEDLISARPDALIGLIQKTRADQTSKHYARFEDHMKRQTSVARLGGVSQALVASFIRNAVINGRKSEKFQSLDAVCGLASELLALGIGIYRISASSTTTAEVTLEKMYPCSSIGMHLLLQKADTELSLMIPINPHQDPSVATDWTVVRVADRMQHPLDVSKELAVCMGFRYFLHAFNPRQLENYCLGYLMPKDGVHEIRLDLTGVPADIRFLIEGCQETKMPCHIFATRTPRGSHKQAVHVNYWQVDYVSPDVPLRPDDDGVIVVPVNSRAEAAQMVVAQCHCEMLDKRPAQRVVAAPK